MDDTQIQQPRPEAKKDTVKESKQNQTAGNTQEKDWWEQLLGTTEQDGIKNIYKLITHPLALVTVLVFMLFWSLKQKKTDSGISKENEELKGELAFMKKKYKKLKKCMQETSDTTTENPDKPIKRPLVLVD
jgi:membrane protein insertase Oxa1/YidC/SpoIIIJ